MPAQRSRCSILPSEPVTGVPADGIDFDAVVSFTEQRQGTAIRHAKQSGGEGLVDDVDLQPLVLSMSAHINDFPLYALGFTGRSIALKQAVFAIQRAKVPCTVIFGDDVYPSMVIETLSRPVTAETGDAVDLEISLAHVEIGELQTFSSVVDAQTQALGDVTAIDIGFLP